MREGQKNVMHTDINTDRQTQKQRGKTVLIKKIDLKTKESRERGKEKNIFKKIQRRV